jgi:putative ABC transport system permease protein
MSLYYIALNNLRRRKAKAVFALLGMILGIATMVSVYSVVEAMKEEMVRQSAQFGAQVIITPSMGELAFSYGGVTLPEIIFDVERLSMEDVAALEKVPGRDTIRAVAPKLLGVVTTDKGHNLVVAGVDMSQEFLVKPWLRLEQGQDMAPEDEGDPSGNPMDVERLDLAREDFQSFTLGDREVLVGAKSTALLGISPGGVLTLGEENFQVLAVLTESGSPEDEQVLMNLETAQTFFNSPNEITLIELAVDYSLISETALIAQLNAALPGADVKSLRQETLRRDEMLTRLTRFGLSVAVLILFAGTLVVFLTMSSGVRERTREIAVFRAIGFRKVHIIKIIILEGALVSLVGGVLGYAVGYLLSRFAGPLLAGMAIQVSWRADLLLPAVALALVSGLLASILPARQASNLDPAEALRYI